MAYTFSIANGLLEVNDGRKRLLLLSDTDLLPGENGVRIVNSETSIEVKIADVDGAETAADVMNTITGN